MENKNISIKEMLSLSDRLYQKNRHKWGENTPESNIAWVGWLVGEIGEVLDIIKKQGVDRIMNDKEIRQEMLTEITDCYMYLADILNRYEYKAEGFSKTYLEKMNHNLKRDYYKTKIEIDKN